jgi:hypothetical protein
LTDGRNAHAQARPIIHIGYFAQYQGIDRIEQPESYRAALDGYQVKIVLIRQALRLEQANPDMPSWNLRRQCRMDTTDTPVIEATRSWLERAVIGLNLCPFAKAVHVKQQIRYVVSHADTPEALLEELVGELQLLAAADPQQVEMTLLMHPQVLQDFLDYNDFLELADTAIEQLDLGGVLQIASFHPDYQFAGTSPDDIENYTNRSPYPTLHLLREASIDQAVAAFPDAADIFERNIETLQRLGLDGWKKLFSA